MDAIYRVDGNHVVTSPNAAGPWDPRMQHGSAPAALVVWAAEAIPAPEPMQIARVTIDLMRPVPVAPLTLETEILREGRKIQLCAVRLRAGDAVVVSATVLKIKTQALQLPSGDRGCAGRTSRPRSGARRAAEFFQQSIRNGHLDARRAGPFRRARSRCDLVSGRPAAGRGLRDFASHARRGRRGFLQRHLGSAGFRRMDLHQCRSHGQFCAPAGRRLDLARRGILRSGPMAPALPWRGSPTNAAISAAPCKASWSRSDKPNRLARAIAS